MEGDVASVPRGHGLRGVQDQLLTRLAVRTVELQGGFEFHFIDINGLEATGLTAGDPSSGHHGRCLVPPVTLHRCQDVISQRVEVNASEVGFRRGVPSAVLFQDPEEDVTHLAHVGKAFPSSQFRMRPLARLGEEEQLLFIQPDGSDNGNNLLTGNRAEHFH